MGMNSGSHKAQVEVRARTTDAQKNLNKLAREVDKLSRRVQTLSAKNKKAASTFAAIEAHAKTLRSGAMAVGAAVIGAVYAIDRLAEREVEWSNVNNKLRISVDAAAEAVSNQTSKLELARHASKLNSQGIATSSAEYAKLTGMVAQLADAHGVDLNTALAQTTKAILKGNSRGLEQLGIYADVSLEIDKYAKAQGKSTTEVTLAEKQQIALNLIMKDGALEAAALGKTVENSAHGWVAFKNKAINALDELNDSLWTLDDTAEETLNNGVRWWFELIGRDAEHAALGVWQVNEAIEQMGKEAQRALAFVAPLVSIQYGGDFTGTSMEGGDFTDLANSMKDGSAKRLADAQAAEKSHRQQQEQTRAIMENARKVQLAVRNASQGEGGKKGRGSRKQDSEELYAAELRRIKLMEFEIEKQQALGQSTEAFERKRLELMLFVAKAKGDQDKIDKVRHEDQMRRIKLQQEWDQKRAESAIRRLEAEGAEHQRKSELEALELEGRLIGEENEVAAHQVRMQIAAVEAEQLQGELDTRRQILEARFPADEAERMEIQAELTALDHEQRMALLSEEQEQRRLGWELQQKIEEQAAKARQKRIESIRATARMSDSVLSASADIAQISADRGNAAGEKAAKAFMKVRGIMAVAQGAFDTAQAVSAFASFNYVQGAMYVASAATNFATGAKLLAGDPGGGGGGGAYASEGPLGGNRYGGGTGAAPTATTRSGETDPTSVPRSVPADETGGTGGQTGSGSQKSGQTIIVQGDVVGDVTPAWTKKITKAQERQEYGGKVKA